MIPLAMKEISLMIFVLFIPLTVSSETTEFLSFTASTISTSSATIPTTPCTNSTNPCCLSRSTLAPEVLNCYEIDVKAGESYILRLADFDDQGAVRIWTDNVKHIKDMDLIIEDTVLNNLTFIKLESLQVKNFIVADNSYLKLIALPSLLKMDFESFRIVDNPLLENVYIANLQEIKGDFLEIIDNPKLYMFLLFESSLVHFILGNVMIETNNNLQVIMIQVQDTFEIGGTMNISNNYHLESILLPMNAAKQSNTIVVTKNNLLSDLWIPHGTNLTLMDCPQIDDSHLEMLKETVTNPQQIQEKSGECSFWDPLNETRYIDKCRSIKTSLVFAPDAEVNNMKGIKIEKIDGDLDLGNLELWALHHFFDTTVTGTLKSSLCGFNYSRFVKAIKTEETVPCPTTPRPAAHRNNTADPKKSELARMADEYAYSKGTLGFAVALLGAIVLGYIALTVVVLWRTDCLGYYDEAAVQRREFKKQRRETIDRERVNRQARAKRSQTETTMRIESKDVEAMESVTILSERTPTADAFRKEEERK